MRLGLVVIAFAACSSAAAPRGPVWPKQTIASDDGGESLAPRAAARAIAAVVEDDKPAERAADKPASAAAASDPTDPAATPPTMIFEEPIMTEEIVIEIESD